MDENTQQTSIAIEESRCDCEKECPCEITSTMLCEEDTVIDEEEEKKIKRITIASFSLAILALFFTIAFAFSYTISKTTRTKAGVLFFFLYCLCISAAWILWVFSYKFNSTLGQASFVISIATPILWALQLFLILK